jgi:predicted DNA-binding ribbon-helix-helix protein
MVPASISPIPSFLMVNPPHKAQDNKNDPSTTPKKVAKSTGGKKSHIDFALQTRHIDTDGKRTTIALEKAFWRQADIHAERVGQSWQQWAAGMLEDRPSNIGKARWLRVRLLVGEC